MILSRMVRIQLVIFIVITIAVVTFGSLRYVQLPRMLGMGTYPIQANLTDGARLYPNALVTYRGIQVGKVSKLELTRGGVHVSMRIDNGIRIPGDVRAEAHSVSAVGEQYIDLVPQRDGGPYLGAGDTIAGSRTAVPVEIGTVLDRLNALTTSIPKNDLNVVIDELYRGFGGQGDNMRRLLDSSRSLIGSARSNLQPTQGLVDSLVPVLETQRDVSAPIRQLTHDLASFTDQLRASDPELRQVVEQTPEFSKQINDLFREVRPTLPLLLANMVSTGQVAVTYLSGVRQLLVVYPAVIDSFYTALSPNPQRELVKIDFKLNVNDPGVCTKGFIPVSQRRSPADLTPAPVPTDVYCKESPKDPRDVRGARNLPCPNDPGRRAGTPEACGLSFHRASPYPGRVSDDLAVGAAPYDATSGRFEGPDGLTYVLGDVGAVAPARTWQGLLRAPLTFNH
jgi:phospholipid/cholesterol/gamma-HCH transport system substrate-binding protein